MLDEIVPLEESGLYAANTPLGLVVFGQMIGGRSTPYTCLLTALLKQSLYDLLASYFETENFTCSNVAQGFCEEGDGRFQSMLL